jgi:hypothetical protein
MKISRQLEVHRWDQAAAAAALAFWKRRGFKNVAIDLDLELVGSRGSWFGNLTSFDMSKLKTSLRMSSWKSDRVVVELDVNTFGQHITEWNRAYWRLEIIELHTILICEGDISALWERFRQDSRRASILWAVSSTILGQRLPKDLEATISMLESGETRYD